MQALPEWKYLLETLTALSIGSLCISAVFQFFVLATHKSYKSFVVCVVIFLLT